MVSALVTQCSIVYFKCLHGVCKPELKLGTIFTKGICFSVLIVSKIFLKYLFSKLLKILYGYMYNFTSRIFDSNKHVISNVTKYLLDSFNLQLRPLMKDAVILSLVQICQFFNKASTIYYDNQQYAIIMVSITLYICTSKRFKQF